MKKVVVFFFLVIIFQSRTDVLAASQISFQLEMLPWEEADKLLPKYTKFTVMDVDTGKQFQVQRRAGSHHADVQPLTAKDTKIMKSIYNGKWSWKRRAVIIIYKDQWVAASMHGMPHGAGALHNNFPGHFCIHFIGSTTHRTNSMDLSHMLMIYKASGQLEEYLSKAGPYEVIQAFIAGLKQRDEVIASSASLQRLEWKPAFSQIENVAIKRLPLLSAEDFTTQISLDIPIEIDWVLKKTGRQTYSGELHLVRFSQFDRWKIDSIHFLKENNMKIKKQKTSIN